jgi:hypothetical protein
MSQRKAIFISLIFTLASVGGWFYYTYVINNKIAPHIEYIPANASAVMIVNTHEMAGKFVYQAIFNYEDIEDFIPEKSEKKYKGRWDAGINLLQQFAVFVFQDESSGKQYLGVMFGLTDKAEFQKLLSGKWDLSNIKQKGKVGYKQLEPMLGVAFTDKTGVMVLAMDDEWSKGNLKENAIGVLQTKKKQSLLHSNPTFRGIFDQEFDIAFWSDLNWSVGSTSWLREGLISFTEGTTALWEFEEKKVDVKLSYGIKPEQRSIFSHLFTAAKHDVIQQDAFASTHFSLDQQQLKTFFEQNGLDQLVMFHATGKATENRQLFDLFSNGVQVNFTGISSYDMGYIQYDYDEDFNKVAYNKEKVTTLPQFSAFAKVNDGAQLQNILSGLASDSVLIPHNGYYELVNGSAYKVYLKAMETGHLCITTDKSFDDDYTIASTTLPMELSMDFVSLIDNWPSSSLQDMLIGTALGGVNNVEDLQLVYDQYKDNALQFKGDFEFLEKNKHTLIEMVHLFQRAANYLL